MSIGDGGGVDAHRGAEGAALAGRPGRCRIFARVGVGEVGRGSRADGGFDRLGRSGEPRAVFSARRLLATGSAEGNLPGQQFAQCRIVFGALQSAEEVLDLRAASTRQFRRESVAELVNRRRARRRRFLAGSSLNGHGLVAAVKGDGGSKTSTAGARRRAKTEDN